MSWMLHNMYLYYCLGFPGGSVVKNPPAMQEPQEMWVWSLGLEDHLEEALATHTSIPAKIIHLMDRGAWQLQSRGSQSVICDWAHTIHCFSGIQT